MSGFLGNPFLQEVIEEVEGTRKTSFETSFFISEKQNTNLDRDVQVRTPVVWLPTSQEAVSTFVSFQKWEGSVLSINKDSFRAYLIDLEHTNPDEEAEILLDEVSAQDIPLVKLGAIFYWHIGYHEDKVGQRRRVSVLRFRRLPVWRKEELDRAKEKANQLRDLIEWK